MRVSRNEAAAVSHPAWTVPIRYARRPLDALHGNSMHRAFRPGFLGVFWNALSGSRRRHGRCDLPIRAHVCCVLDRFGGVRHFSNRVGSLFTSVFRETFMTSTRTAVKVALTLGAAPLLSTDDAQAQGRGGGGGQQEGGGQQGGGGRGGQGGGGQSGGGQQSSGQQGGGGGGQCGGGQRGGSQPSASQQSGGQQSNVLQGGGQQQNALLQQQVQAMRVQQQQQQNAMLALTRIIHLV